MTPCKVATLRLIGHCCTLLLVWVFWYIAKQLQSQQMKNILGNGERKKVKKSTEMFFKTEPDWLCIYPLFTIICKVKLYKVASSIADPPRANSIPLQNPSLCNPHFMTAYLNNKWSDFQILLDVGYENFYWLGQCVSVRFKATILSQNIFKTHRFTCSWQN